MNLLYSFIISKILVYIFNSFLTNPWNSIEKGCHTNCVTFLAFLTTYFDEHSCLPVMLSLLPHVLWGRSQVSLSFASVVSPGSLYFYILLLLMLVSWSPCLKHRHGDCLAFKKLQITQVLWK
jgi:hypothetical protein